MEVVVFCARMTKAVAVEGSDNICTRMKKIRTSRGVGCQIIAI
jgi:hypothetical protein